jgi:competence protein ComEA
MEEPVPSVSSVFREYKLPIVLGIISIVSIVFSIIFFIKAYQPEGEIQFVTRDSVAGDATGSAVSDFVVDVEGAVKHPGVYHLSVGSRIDDAIVAAGGLTAEADTTLLAGTVNRATKIVDGAKVLIPAKGQSIPSVHSSGGVRNGLININTATAGELESLPGIGAVTAQKIIDSRPYQTIDELMTRKVLGQSLFAKVKDRLGL